MKHLTLHAGTSKTGTSTIQATLSANRDWLQARGVVYPDQSGQAHHHDFARAVSEDEASAKCFVDDALVAAAEGRVIVSSEIMYLRVVGGLAYSSGDAYWGRREAYLDALDRVTAGVPRTVVVVLRRPDEFAESLYKTAVQRRDVAVPFAQFRDRIRPLVDYDRQLHEFRKRFDDVQALRFSDIRMNIVGELARVLLERSQRGGSQRGLRSFLRSERCRRLFAGSQTTLWESVRAREEYCRSVGWGDDEAATNSTYVPSLGAKDRAALSSAFLMHRMVRLFGSDS